MNLINSKIKSSILKALDQLNDCISISYKRKAIYIKVKSHNHKSLIYNRMKK